MSKPILLRVAETYVDNLMTRTKKEEITTTAASCPYCESKFRDNTELSKHIDRIHTSLGLLEGDKRQW